MPLRTANGSATTRDIALDANVSVAQLAARHGWGGRAHDLGERLCEEGAELGLLEIAVKEAVSVPWRPAREWRNELPDLGAVVGTARRWAGEGAISICWVAAKDVGSQAPQGRGRSVATAPRRGPSGLAPRGR